MQCTLKLNDQKTEVATAEYWQRISDVSNNGTSLGHMLNVGLIQALIADSSARNNFNFSNVSCIGYYRANTGRLPYWHKPMANRQLQQNFSVFVCYLNNFFWKLLKCNFLIWSHSTIAKLLKNTSTVVRFVGIVGARIRESKGRWRTTMSVWSTLPPTIYMSAQSSHFLLMFPNSYKNHFFSTTNIKFRIFQQKNWYYKENT